MSKVTIESDRGRLRLRWQHQGKRYALSLGVDDSPTGQAVARERAARIEKDIVAGYFDPTLLKYKPQTLGKNGTELTVVDLFDRYSQAMKRDKALSQNGFQKYTALLSHLQRFFSSSKAHAVSDRQAGNFVAYLLKHMVGQTAKQYVFLLRGCWDWAKDKYHIVPDNPWTAQVHKIKPQPKQKVKPFTMAEVKAILEGFKTDRYYSHYCPFAAFLFGTGVRIGEAAGLRWKHLSDTFETCWIGETVSRGTRKTTKTGKARTIRLSLSVQALLKERFEAVKPKPEDLVFTAPKGGPISDRLFNRRAWKKVLEKLNIPYRKPYTARHTAISHALANGANPIELAEQTGHDKRVLLETYAHAIQQQSLFVEF